MSTRQPEMFSRSILVVAHPDDEILWFSSIVDKVDEVLFCFSDYPPLPSLGNGREKALAAHPLDNVSSLEIGESGAFNAADWNNPAPSPWGMAITRGKRTRQRYQENYHTLEKRLGEKLRGYRNVFTHNPWGEYGHEEHVQVYRAVDTLRRRHAFRLWFSNYAGNRSARLMFSYLSGFHDDYVTLPANPALAESIAAIYKRHDCWTWYDDYRWFNEECFANDGAIGGRDTGFGHLFPVNMLKTDFPGQPQSSARSAVSAIRKTGYNLYRALRRI